MSTEDLVLTPESDCPGAPVAPANPDHQPRVPMAGGVPPYCSCGFVGGRGVEIDGRPLLAEHIAETGGYGPRATVHDSRCTLDRHHTGQCNVSEWRG